MILYDELINLSKFYLGPAGESFLARQLALHMKITSVDLAAAHLEELAKYCFSSSKLLIDENKAGEFRDKILALQKK